MIERVLGARAPRTPSPSALTSPAGPGGEGAGGGSGRTHRASPLSALTRPGRRGRPGPGTRRSPVQQAAAHVSSGSWARNTSSPWASVRASPGPLARRRARSRPATSSPPYCPCSSGSSGLKNPLTLDVRAGLARWTGSVRGVGDAARARGPVRRPAARVSADPWARSTRTRSKSAAALPLDIGPGGDRRRPRACTPLCCPCESRYLAPNILTLDVRSGLARWIGSVGDAAPARGPVHCPTAHV